MDKCITTRQSIVAPLNAKIRLCFTFGREYSVTAIVITALCAWFIYDSGMGAFAPVFFFKLAMIAIMVYFIDMAKKRQYYYYYNLGLSKRGLWGTVIAADTLLFIMSILTATLFR